MAKKEGYIKFNCVWKNENFDFQDDLFQKFNEWRSKLYKLNCIGCYENGIGFGNISIRIDLNKFIITGSATGAKNILCKDDFSLVESYDFSKNELTCVGNTQASSESLSHAAIYEKNKNIDSVIHIHHLELWEILKNNYPTTDIKVEFGTPEMAFEIQKVMSHENIIVMGGHKEGIIFFGRTIDEAGGIIKNLFKKYLP